MKLRKRAYQLLIAISFMAITIPIAYAQSQTDDCVFVVSGEITAKSPNIVRSQYSSLLSERPTGCGTVFVQFNSPGGSVEAAIAIGLYLRQKEVITVVPNGATCASACVLAFLGGVSRHLIAGRFGIHRPYDPRYSSSVRESKDAFTKVNLAIKKYFDEINVNEAVLSAMNAVPPGEIRWLDERERIALQIQATDPVWEDTSDSRLAMRLGISKRELYDRQSRANASCATNQPAVQRLKCYWSIVNPTNL